MPPLTIPCPHCSQSCQVDSDRLPDQPVGFPCPHCKGKVVVDKRQMLQDRRFAKLPPDATLPSGIILGEDDAAIAEIQEKLAGRGSKVDRVGSADEARHVIVSEQPELCIYVGGSVTAPPYAPLAPLTGLPPTFRRRLYLALVADNLKTLDGAVAFLYQVNMILAKQDLSQLGPALYTGVDYHARLYAPYFEAAEKRGLI